MPFVKKRHPSQSWGIGFKLRAKLFPSILKFCKILWICVYLPNNPHFSNLTDQPHWTAALLYYRNSKSHLRKYLAGPSCFELKSHGTCSILWVGGAVFTKGSIQPKTNITPCRFLWCAMCCFTMYVLLIYTIPDKCWWLGL